MKIHSDTSTWAIVPAAGIGQRVGQKLPKQYLSILGKTIIEHTLSRLLAVEAISAIIVALHRHDHYFTGLPISKHPRIFPVIGGEERSDSVLSALNHLQGKAKLSDWVLVHDSVRCCILSETIRSLLIQFEKDPVGGIVAVPASDTLKKINPRREIVKTLDRQLIWQAQTPQMFRFGVLRDALQKARHQYSQVTDEASALELMGLQPRVFEGDYHNIKITHPEDLVIAEAILKQQVNQQQKV